MVALHRLALLGAALLSLCAGACADSGHCEAALAGVERAQAATARQEAQIMWLRGQLAAFAGDLQARSAADRDVLLHRLAALEATNAALVERLDQAQRRADPRSPEPALPAAAKPVAAPPSPVMPATVPGPPPPVYDRMPAPRPVRPAEAQSKARRIDESSPY
jgi:hypothetical protein